MSQTLFITGASTGIGKATAFHFRKQGWNVAATVRDPAPHSDLRDAGIQTIALDVTAPETIKPALDAAVKAFGKIDVLVNNAGYGAMGPLEAATNEQIERQYSTNVTGLLFVTREFLPHFRANGGGVIINISSVGGVAAFPLFSLYHGTKWAVEGISESLNFELNPLGIRVKLIEPGRIKTDFGSRSLDILKQDGLTAYDAFVAKMTATRSAAAATAPGPEIVAEVIWQAATDGTDQLRYIAGEDAKTIIETRAKISQEEYYAMIRQRFGI
jgi:NAD(P)-dependent dehydrogenase (short-subunit alcohol dehydrogenase family)